MIKQDKVITVFLVILITALIGQIRAVILQEKEYKSSIEAMKRVEIRTQYEKNSKKTNKNCVCILRIPETSINYPIMQSSKAQPDYYLNHDALNHLQFL